MMHIQQYKKQYGSHLVMAVEDMQLEHNIYWLKGENGSGKSTLIKSMAGIIPFHGDITLHGVNIRKQEVAYRRLVNYAEAEPQYPSFLSGNDLLRFYADVKGVASGQQEQLCSAFGIDGYKARQTGGYSSGMAKKLSLVLAFMGAARLILLDEPLITLDHAAVAVLKDTIAAAYRAGVSFIITSHQEMAFEGFEPARLLVQDKKLMRL